MVPQFCGNETFCNVVGDRRALARAKEAVSRDFPVIGIMEMFQESLALYSRAYPKVFGQVDKVYISYAKQGNDYYSIFNLQFTFRLRAFFQKAGV